MKNPVSESSGPAPLRIIRSADPESYADLDGLMHAILLYLDSSQSHYAVLGRPEEVAAAQLWDLRRVISECRSELYRLHK